MNISGIRPYAGLYTGQVHNSVARSTQEVSTDLATQAAGASNDSLANVGSEPQRGQSFGAYDFAQQYDPRTSYEMKGQDSDLRTLDVENAISAMQKDSVLQQYQFFVGSDAATSGAAADLHPVENFSF